MQEVNINEVPPNTNFVAVWEAGGRLWCRTCHVDHEERTHYYNVYERDWALDQFPFDSMVGITCYMRKSLAKHCGIQNRKLIKLPKPAIAYNYVLTEVDIDDMPPETNFISVWMRGGENWCETNVKTIDGRIQAYTEGSGGAHWHHVPLLEWAKRPLLACYLRDKKQVAAKLLRVAQYPKDGTQFVAVWLYKGCPCAREFRYLDGELQILRRLDGIAVDWVSGYRYDMLLAGKNEGVVSDIRFFTNG